MVDDETRDPVAEQVTVDELPSFDDQAWLAFDAKNGHMSNRPTPYDCKFCSVKLAEGDHKVCRRLRDKAALQGLYIKVGPVINRTAKRQVIQRAVRQGYHQNRWRTRDAVEESTNE